MPPPTTSVSTLVASTLSTASLSATLAPADDRHEGPRGSLEDLPQDLHLAGEAQAGGAGQEGGRADDGGVGAVRGAEGLVDVGVEALYQALHEGRVVGLLARVEAQVLGQPDPRAQHLRGARRTGSISQRGSGAPAGPAQMRRRHHLRPLVLQPAQGRQGRRDAEVVGHGGLAPHADVQGDVEVDPHQHPLARRGRAGPRAAEYRERVHRAQPPTTVTRSTRRFE